MTRILSFLLLVAVTLIVSCEEEVVLPTEYSLLEQYYPLELDRAAYYRVDSVILVNTVAGTRYDTARVEARETLVEQYAGADGATIYRGERWERSAEDMPYTFKQTFTITRTDRAILRSEDNLTFIKLVLPIGEETTWDGNADFDQQRRVSVGGEMLDVYNGWKYQYSAVGQSMTLNTGVAVDSVVTVQQANVDNLIDLRQAYESYASGLGLVERFIDARHTQCKVCCNGDTGSCVDLPWDEKAEKGYIIRQSLIGRD